MQPKARETLTRADVAMAENRMDRRMAEAVADIRAARTEEESTRARLYHDVVVAENSTLLARIALAMIVDN